MYLPGIWERWIQLLPRKRSSGVGTCSLHGREDYRRLRNGEERNTLRVDPRVNRWNKDPSGRKPDASRRIESIGQIWARNRIEGEPDTGIKKESELDSDEEPAEEEAIEPMRGSWKASRKQRGTPTVPSGWVSCKRRWIPYMRTTHMSWRSCWRERRPFVTSGYTRWNQEMAEIHPDTKQESSLLRLKLTSHNNRFHTSSWSYLASYVNSRKATCPSLVGI